MAIVFMKLFQDFEVPHPDRVIFLLRVDVLCVQVNSQLKKHSNLLWRKIVLLKKSFLRLDPRAQLSFEVVVLIIRMHLGVSVVFHEDPQGLVVGDPRWGIKDRIVVACGGGIVVVSSLELLQRVEVEADGTQGIDFVLRERSLPEKVALRPGPDPDGAVGLRDIAVPVFLPGFASTK